MRLHGPGDSNSSLDASCIMMINGRICGALVLASGCLFRHVHIILPQVLFYGEIFNSGFIFEDLNRGQDPSSTRTWWSWWGKEIAFTLRDLFLHQTSQAIGIMTRVNTPDETASLVSPAKFTFHTPPPPHLATVFDSSWPFHLGGNWVIQWYSYHPAVITLKADLTASRKHGSQSAGLLMEAL